MIERNTASPALYIYVLLLLLGFAFVPAVAKAAPQQTAAWVPWWAEEAGAESARAHIKSLDIIYPFVFEVTSEGALTNKVDFKDRHWSRLFSAADKNHVDVLPTVMWFDGDAIDRVLSSKTERKKHVDAIVKMVKQYKFDGVNIDYESKKSETRDDFSLFLKELSRALGSRLELTCTVEARTPPDSLWREVPENIEYSNDYGVINKYCDQIEIMAYDQQRADLKLNDKRRGVPYMPVADTEWVEKILDLALKDFDSDKVMLGVPTYGRAWDVTVAADWYKDYKQVATLNTPRILELAKKYNAPIGRTAAGEAVITYFPEDSAWKVFDKLPAPKDTPKGFEAAAKALMVATYADVELPVRFVTWSDAIAVEEKVNLADKYNLKGVAIFKVDGEEDSEIWKAI